MSVTSSSWCLGMAAVCDCGTPWTFLLPFFFFFFFFFLRGDLFILCVTLCYFVLGHEKKRNLIVDICPLRSWPWRYRPGSCTRHIFSWWLTFYHVISKSIKEWQSYWRGHEKRPHFLTFTSKCDLDLGATDLSLARDISSYEGQYVCRVISKFIKEWPSYGPDTKIRPCYWYSQPFISKTRLYNFG